MSQQTFIRFRLDEATKDDSMRICRWLNKCSDAGGNVNHYWRSNYVLVDFDRAEDAMAFKLVFDLKWITDREIRI